MTCEHCGATRTTDEAFFDGIARFLGRVKAFPNTAATVQ